MESLVYLDGRFVSLDEAKISVFDLSILRGYGISDYFRTYQHRPFCLEDHLNRLEKSAKKLEITLPKSRQEITLLVKEAIRLLPNSELQFKIIVTGGATSDQYMPDGPSKFIMIITPVVPYPKKIYETGIYLITETFERAFPLAKTIEYTSAILGMKKAIKVGAQEVLYLSHEGNLLEAGKANFFAFKKGVLITPSQGIVKGITRKVVLELAQGLFPIEERNISSQEIATFDGAFVTSGTQGVLPVTKIDKHIIGTGDVPCEVKSLMEAFTHYSEGLLALT